MVRSQQRLLLRAAARIQRQYGTAPDSRISSLPEEGFRECQNLLGLVRLARRRGWHHAGRELRERFRYAAGLVQRELESLVQQLQEETPEPFVPTLRQLYDELVALHDEFEEVEIVLRQGTLLVRTEPVVLDDVELGRFEIRLEWERLRYSPSYRVRALTPRPAAADGRTIHPHIRGEQLCEGDGQRPIRKALAQGRLCDLFLIVAQILGTYNAGNAYVSLADWQGRPCRDCGGAVPDEDARECERCGAALCPDCLSRCAACSEACCGDCSAPCESCQDPSCERCLTCCPHCQGDLCDDCLAEHDCRNDDPEADRDPVDGDGAPLSEAGTGVDAEGGDAPAAAVLAGGLGAAPGPA